MGWIVFTKLYCTHALIYLVDLSFIYFTLTWVDLDCKPSPREVILRIFKKLICLFIFGGGVIGCALEEPNETDPAQQSSYSELVLKFTYFKNVFGSGFQTRYSNFLRSDPSFSAKKAELQLSVSKISEQLEGNNIDFNFGSYLRTPIDNTATLAIVPNAQIAVPFLNATRSDLELNYLKLAYREKAVSMQEEANASLFDAISGAIDLDYERQKSKLLLDQLSQQETIADLVEEKFKAQRASKYERSVAQQSLLASRLQLQVSEAKLEKLTNTLLARYGFIPDFSLGDFTQSTLETVKDHIRQHNYQALRYAIQSDTLNLRIEEKKLESKPKLELVLGIEAPIDIKGSIDTVFTSRVNLLSFDWAQNEKLYSDVSFALEREALENNRAAYEKELTETLFLASQNIEALAKARGLQRNLVEVLKEKKSSLMQLYSLNRISIDQIKSLNMELLDAQLETLNLTLRSSKTVLDVMSKGYLIDIVVMEDD